ncbi:MAG TPA: hypothetical protein VNY73_08625 [Bacteroidia bacterium]|jgi:lipid II:glycine glycyltransferase (peptidoglycan interpeptide bridge formation enzyme)|nr:hypothetical protein [Bacteroidia bacterium]
MLEITTHKFAFFTRKEFWFYKGEKIARGTYNTFCFTEEGNPEKKNSVLKQQTSLIDLERSEEDLFSAINRTFKFQVKKAEKKGIKSVTDFNPDSEKCEEIAYELSSFARKRSFAWSKQRILALQKINRLIITHAVLHNEILATHIYLHDTHCVSLLHSYTNQKIADKKLKGYANKLLHWNDMIACRKYGLKVYDFGGINPEKHPGITAFKLSFGGTRVDRYSYVETSPLVFFLIKLMRKK